MTFAYKIICGAGVLVQGAHADFLVCLAIAREKKLSCEATLPETFFRVHVFYPNYARVPHADLAAAYLALDSAAPGTDLGCPTRASIGQFVRLRATASQNSPARSVARTAEFCEAVGRGLAVAVESRESCNTRLFSHFEISQVSTGGNVFAARSSR